MKIIITGASGLIGQALVKKLAYNHQLTLVGRDIKKLEKLFPNQKKITWSDLNHYQENIDLLIHLAGESVGQRFWSKSFKQKILDSRTKTTETIIKWLSQQEKKPRIFAANAVGYYGNFKHSQGYSLDESKTQDEMHPNSFLQQVAFAWQSAWTENDLKLDICFLRFGIVLKKQFGFLKQLWPSFILGFGAIIGSGQQMLSWIYWEDLVSAIIWLIEHDRISGPINLVSPYAVTQQEFAESYAKVLHRPLWLRLPTKIIQCIFGEMGQELLLSGQEVYPRRLLESGFDFKFPQLDLALEHEYQKEK